MCFLRLDGAEAAVEAACRAEGIEPGGWLTCRSRRRRSNLALDFAEIAGLRTAGVLV